MPTELPERSEDTLQTEVTHLQMQEESLSQAHKTIHCKRVKQYK